MNNTISDSLKNLRDALTTWYMGLDDQTQYYFESAYTQNRRAIANGLGGWTVTDDELSHNSTLAALLAIEADGEPSDVLPHIAGAMAPVTEPANAQANQDFKLVWVDINYGTATSGYQDAGRSTTARTTRCSRASWTCPPSTRVRRRLSRSTFLVCRQAPTRCGSSTTRAAASKPPTRSRVSVWPRAQTAN